MKARTTRAGCCLHGWELFSLSDALTDEDLKDHCEGQDPYTCHKNELSSTNLTLRPQAEPTRFYLFPYQADSGHRKLRTHIAGQDKRAIGRMDHPIFTQQGQMVMAECMDQQLDQLGINDILDVQSTTTPQKWANKVLYDVDQRKKRRAMRYSNRALDDGILEYDDTSEPGGAVAEDVGTVVPHTVAKSQIYGTVVEKKITTPTKKATSVAAFSCKDVAFNCIDDDFSKFGVAEGGVVETPDDGNDNVGDPVWSGGFGAGTR